MNRRQSRLKLVENVHQFVAAVMAVHHPVATMLATRSMPLRYHDGAHCPGCDARNWYIGRSSAECARCGTALPLAHGVD